MRVTKLIREYVEREVHAKFKSKIAALEENFRNEQDEVLNLINERIDSVDKECIKILSDAGFDTPKNRLISRIGYYSIRRENTEEEIRKRRAELHEKERETIDSILIGLEIGETTKDELKGLIANVEV